jgi:hypothetical protein
VLLVQQGLLAPRVSVKRTLSTKHRTKPTRQMVKTCTVQRFLLEKYIVTVSGQILNQLGNDNAALCTLRGANTASVERNVSLPRSSHVPLDLSIGVQSSTAQTVQLSCDIAGDYALLYKVSLSAIKTDALAITNP